MRDDRHSCQFFGEGRFRSLFVRVSFFRCCFAFADIAITDHSCNKLSSHGHRFFVGARAPIRRTEFCAVSNFAPRRRQVAAWISWFSGVLYEKKSWKRNGARELEVSHWSTPRFDNTAQLSKRHRSSVASSPHSIPVSENRQITTNECRFWRRKFPSEYPSRGQFAGSHVHLDREG